MLSNLSVVIKTPRNMRILPAMIILLIIGLKSLMLLKQRNHVIKFKHSYKDSKKHENNASNNYIVDHRTGELDVAEAEKTCCHTPV